MTNTWLCVCRCALQISAVALSSAVSGFQAPAGLAQTQTRAGAVSMMDLDGLKAQAKEVRSAT